MNSSDRPQDNPFFDLGALFGRFQNQDPWRQAAEVATTIASNNNTEPNLDPIQRMQVEDLARVAELQVAQAVSEVGFGLPTATRVEAVTRAVWAGRSVEAYRPFFERFTEAIADSMGTPVAGEAGETPGMSLVPTEMMSQMFASLGPMLVSGSVGSMIGHLGQGALGQYDLPIPRPSDGVLIVPSTLDERADEWDVEVADLRLWVLIHELTAHATLSIPHVRARLEALLIDFASAFRPNQDLIQQNFGALGSMDFGIDPSTFNPETFDPSTFDPADFGPSGLMGGEWAEMAERLNDPDVVLSMMRSPAQDLLVPQLDALVAAVLGFVDHTVTSICSTLIPSHDRIRDRMRERWIDVAPADRFMERLLGLEIDEATLDRGANFIDGIMTRAGQAGLARLWTDELDLPTAAEVDAPGLWLARIGLGDDADTILSTVPDDLSGLDLGSDEVGPDEIDPDSDGHLGPDPDVN